MKIILSWLCLVFSITAHAQSKADTIFYDGIWKPILSKTNFAYYRVVHKVGNLFIVEDHFRNGKLQMTGSFSSLQPEIQEGDFKYYDDKGQLTIERSFAKDLMDGEYKKYYPSGKLHWDIHYKAGVNDGEFLILYENGNVRRKDIYVNGGLASGKCYTEAGKDTTYYPYEVQPSFVYGKDSLLRFLKAAVGEIDYKANASKTTVEIGFVVDEHGKINKLHTMQGKGSSYEHLLQRAVEQMPPWVSGSQDGKVISMPSSVSMDFGP